MFVVRCFFGKVTISLRWINFVSMKNHRDVRCTSLRDYLIFHLCFKRRKLFKWNIEFSILPNVEPAIEPAQRSWDVWLPLCCDDPGNHEATQVNIDTRRLDWFCFSLWARWKRTKFRQLSIFFNLQFSWKMSIPMKYLINEEFQRRTFAERISLDTKEK